MLNKFLKTLGAAVVIALIVFAFLGVALVLLPPMFSAANTLINLAGVGVVVLWLSLLASTVIVVGAAFKLEDKNNA